MLLSFTRLCYLVPTFILGWIFFNQSGSTQSPTLWSTTQIELSNYTYWHNGYELINATSIFDQVHLDPSVQSLIHAAFSQNLYDARVIPFFRKKSGIFPSDDATLITWLTADRLGRLVSLAEKRKAPLSVAFYIPPNDKLATRDLFLLDKLYQTHPALSENVDIHLVTSPFLLQLNTWRTVARTFASTDWVLLWDADFEACTDYKVGLDTFLAQTRDKGWADKLEQGKAALVMTPFQWTDDAFARSRELCPKDKRELATMYHNLTLDGFETENPRLSHGTEYDRLIVSDESDYYPVINYEFGYEVYPLFKRKADVVFDQRFAGYGFERGAMTAQMYLSGMDLYILPGQYAMHQEHPWTSSNGRDEEGAATIPWRTFRMDLCHSLGERLSRKGVLHLSTGDRLLTACQNLEIPEIDRDLNRLISLSRDV